MWEGRWSGRMRQARDLRLKEKSILLKQNKSISRNGRTTDGQLNGTTRKDREGGTEETEQAGGVGGGMQMPLNMY